MRMQKLSLRLRKARNAVRIITCVYIRWKVKIFLKFIILWFRIINLNCSIFLGKIDATGIGHCNRN